MEDRGGRRFVCYPSNDAAVALALGDAYSRIGRRADAQTVYESLSGPMHDNATLWYNLGVLRSQKGDDDGAIQAYQKALELNPDDLDTLNNLGLVLYKKGRFGEARSRLEKILSDYPNAPAAKEAKELLKQIATSE